jgi:hypothetical protein
MNQGRDRGSVAPDPDTNITAASVSHIRSIDHDDPLGVAFTCYAQQRNPEGMAMRQLRAAYGDRYPGSQQRWLDKAPERDAYERMLIEKKGWALYRRVHGVPCAKELERLEFERQTKIKYGGDPVIDLRSYGEVRR